MTFDFSFSYKKKKPMYKNFHFEIPDKKILVVCGHNGAGKTTLLKVLCGLLPSDCKNALGWFVPARGGLITHFSLQEHLHILGKENSPAIKEAWEKFGAEEFAKKRIATLSTGQAMMAAIIVALASDSEVLLLDEPFAGLDPVNAQYLVSILKNCGRTVVITSHDLFLTGEVADKIVFIKNNEISWNYDLENSGKISAEELTESYKQFA